jgi:hypothetical protein
MEPVTSPILGEFLLHHLASYKVSQALSSRYSGVVAPTPSLTFRSSEGNQIPLEELFLQRLEGE